MPGGHIAWAIRQIQNLTHRSGFGRPGALTISQGRNRFHGQRNGPSVDLSLAGLVPRPVGIPRRFNSSAGARWETKPSAISFRMVEANAGAGVCRPLVH
jgi:hypothetical protein